MDIDKLRAVIRDVPDFPKPGILFKDISTLLADPDALRFSIEALTERFRGSTPGKIAGIESRGFPFACAIALELGVGFIPIRKPGKLPADVYSEEYTLEYGTDRVEIHRDALVPDERVLLIDDLLATGGTAAASCRLIEQAGGRVAGVGFVIELGFLGGRGKLEGYDVHALISYDGE